MRDVIVFGINILGQYAVLADDCAGSYFLGFLPEDKIVNQYIVKIVSKNMSLEIKNSTLDGTSKDMLKSFLFTLKFDLPVFEDVPLTSESLNYTSRGELLLVTALGYGITWGEYVAKSEIVEYMFAKKELYKLEMVLISEEDFDVSYLWNPLTHKNMEKLLKDRGSEDMDSKISNLKTLMGKYNWVEYYDGSYGSVPLMALLQTGSFFISREDPCVDNVKFYEKYGLTESPVFKHPLMDHVICFKDNTGKVYVVSQPYLQDEEIEACMKKLPSKKSVTYGDYTSLEYEVLGKDSSFYNKGNTNVVIFHT